MRLDSVEIHTVYTHTHKHTYINILLLNKYIRVIFIFEVFKFDSKISRIYSYTYKNILYKIWSQLIN